MRPEGKYIIYIAQLDVVLFLKTRHCADINNVPIAMLQRELLNKS